MTAEPQRLQYLEAMGITAWVARYTLPNARPTPVCEWDMPEAAPAEAPGDRLHALLDEAVTPQPLVREAPQPARERTQRPANSRKARALLGDVPEEVAAESSPTIPTEPATAEPAEALRYTVQVGCLDGRWLVLLPGSESPGAPAHRLLDNLLHAAGIDPGHTVAFEAFSWPLAEGMPVYAPLEEAREGFAAFVAGCGRRGWRPQRLLMFGHDETLARVVTLEAGHCPLLDLPAWQGPSLDTLAGSAADKRALLPILAEWRDAWHSSAQGVENADDAPPDV
ncbi:hypothetical protein [Halomonas urumqiensis]|uniref:Uncharacterized protein n=1 Tax=Halomonas urumqiensis TaxID=1684789 RepID=A0A2N7UIU2_9GAMM|nr:hypothetical protein [Halomonas urumqiensis]PMR80361.1 hypothetical protein C1H70_09185 [Halomonas urumqiensis]PTB01534.1 hypothetical protein C6V82_14370 [Halomonas urumqiensis]GHE22381.1 hypothetical protein GCM10017767_29020 [Halomonas urumqiensis]